MLEIVPNLEETVPNRFEIEKLFECSFELVALHCRLHNSAYTHERSEETEKIVYACMQIFTM